MIWRLFFAYLFKLTAAFQFFIKNKIIFSLFIWYRTDSEYCLCLYSFFILCHLIDWLHYIHFSKRNSKKLKWLMIALIQFNWIFFFEIASAEIWCDKIRQFKINRYKSINIKKSYQFNWIITIKISGHWKKFFFLTKESHYFIQKKNV